MLDVYYALFVDSDNKLLLLLPYLSTGILNLLQPAQAEVVMGQLSMSLASWALLVISHLVYQAVLNM